MIIAYKGRPLTVRIGSKWIEPGDKVTDEPGSRSGVFCDSRSIAALALRSDFDAAPEKKKSKTMTTETEPNG